MTAVTLNCLIDLDMFFGYGKHRSPASSLVQGLHVAFLILAKKPYEAAGRRPIYGGCMWHFLFWQKFGTRLLAGDPWRTK